MNRWLWNGLLWTGALAGLSVMGSACTGLSMGENDPGDDTHLEAGSIAVDDRTENVFVLQTFCPDSASGSCTGTETKTLHAIHPDDGPIDAMDVTGLSDLRILFPEGDVMLMGERNASEEEIRVIDPDTLAVRTTRSIDARYHGTRMSQSRRWLGVADNSQADSPVHILETAALQPHVVPHDGSWLEAMWLNNRDELLAIVFYEDPAEARILSWNIETIKAEGFPDGSPFWPQEELNVEVPGVERDLAFSYTWVGIDPNDEWAVFPVREGGDHVLKVLDLNEAYALEPADDPGAALRTVPDARGPVGFTPDGSTIVSYRYVDDGTGGTDTQLLLVDAETLDETVMPVPFDGGPTYFVTRDGNFVVLASNLGAEQLVLYDLDNEEVTELAGPDIALSEFVSRTPQGELWLVDDGLHRLDFLSDPPVLETMPLDWTPAHINILRDRDQLVMDDADGGRILFWSPTTHDVVGEVLLPDPPS